MPKMFKNVSECLYILYNLQAILSILIIYRFLRKKSLETHLLSHAGIRPYKCKRCERVYATQSDLNKHLKIHLGDNIYNCSECSKTFKYKIELRQHSSDHFKAKTIQQTSISAQEDHSNISAQLEPMEEILFSE